MRKLLCVQSSQEINRVLSESFQKFSVEAVCCSDPWDALKVGRRDYFHLAIIDLPRPVQADAPDGAELFYLFKNYQVYIPNVILLVESVANYEHLIFEGVTQVVQRPVAISLVVSLAMELLDYQELAQGGSLVA